MLQSSLLPSPFPKNSIIYKFTEFMTELLQNISKIAESCPYLKMLVLFGSRARGDTHSKSDWDFAVFYDDELRQATVKGISQFEIYNILADIFQISSDEIDVVDLNNCSPLLAFHVAKDGKVIYEQTPGEFIKFQMKAWKIYADTDKFRKLQRQSIDLWLEKRGV